MQLHAIQVTGNEAGAHVLVSGSDPFALGHYPGNPIFPGVLTAEHLCMLAQALCAQVSAQPAHATGIKRIQFLDAIVPGDVVELKAAIRREQSGEFEVVASALVGGKPKTRATLQCRTGEQAQPAPWQPHAMPIGERGIEHRELAGVLPQRYPFLLVDRVCDHEPGKHIVGTKISSSALPAMLGMATQPYPQGLVIESIGQLGIALFFLSREERRPVDIVLGSLADVELALPVPADAVLTLDVRIDRQLSNSVILSGEARCNGKLVTRVGSLVAMVDPRHTPS